MRRTWVRRVRAVAAMSAVGWLAACQPVLTGQEFKDFYDRYEPPPATTKITSPPAITGDPGADQRIWSIALRRGYRLRSDHVGRLVTVAGVPVDERVAGPFRALIDEAARNGFQLGAGYGYRPVTQQRSIFVSRLPSVGAIRSGGADGAIDAALMWVAPPGFSKHQSGYTIDFRASGVGGGAFGSSRLGQWLAADNYAAAKRHGFIPSYPSGAGAQGPEPEPWEYVWVGVPAIECSLLLARAGDRSGFDGCHGIRFLYSALGGAFGPLGAVVGPEAPMGDGRGRRETYSQGAILWTPTTGVHEVRGAILDEYRRRGGVTGGLGYPTSDTLTDVLGASRYSNFEGGRIYLVRRYGRTQTMTNPFVFTHELFGGVRGVLGYPVENERWNSGHRGTSVRFEHGWIHQLGGRYFEVHGAVARHHQALGGLGGTLGEPTGNLVDLAYRGGKRQTFTGGTVWYSAGTGARSLTGGIRDLYVDHGGPRGQVGFPLSSMTEVGDGRGEYARFEGGNLYDSTTTDAHEVRGGVLTDYLAAGGPTGPLGYPTGELDPPGTPGGRVQEFEGGSIAYP